MTNPVRAKVQRPTRASVAAILGLGAGMEEKRTGKHGTRVPPRTVVQQTQSPSNSLRDRSGPNANVRVGTVFWRAKALAVALGYRDGNLPGEEDQSLQRSEEAVAATDGDGF